MILFNSHSHSVTKFGILLLKFTVASVQTFDSLTRFIGNGDLLLLVNGEERNTINPGELGFLKWKDSDTLLNNLTSVDISNFDIDAIYEIGNVLIESPIEFKIRNNNESLDRVEFVTSIVNDINDLNITPKFTLDLIDFGLPNQILNDLAESITNFTIKVNTLSFAMRKFRSSDNFNIPEVDVLDLTTHEIVYEDLENNTESYNWSLWIEDRTKLSALRYIYCLTTENTIYLEGLSGLSELIFGINNREFESQNVIELSQDYTFTILNTNTNTLNLLSLESNELDLSDSSAEYHNIINFNDDIIVDTFNIAIRLGGESQTFNRIKATEIKCSYYDTAKDRVQMYSLNANAYTEAIYSTSPYPTSFNSKLANLTSLRVIGVEQKHGALYNVESNYLISHQ